MGGNDNVIKPVEPIPGGSKYGFKPAKSRYDMKPVGEFRDDLAASSGWSNEQISMLTQFVHEDEKLTGVAPELEKAFNDWLVSREATKNEMRSLQDAAAKIPGRRSVLGAGGTVLG